MNIYYYTFDTSVVGSDSLTGKHLPSMLFERSRTSDFLNWIFEIYVNLTLTYATGEGNITKKPILQRGRCKVVNIVCSPSICTMPMWWTKTLPFLFCEEARACQ